jgi:hypothetical protein
MSILFEVNSQLYSAPTVEVIKSELFNSMLTDLGQSTVGLTVPITIPIPQKYWSIFHTYLSLVHDQQVEITNKDKLKLCFDFYMFIGD